MKSLGIVLLGLLLVCGIAFTPNPAAPFDNPPGSVPVKFIGGTLEEIDFAGRRVTIQTERGETESFTLARASLLVGLAEGDRVRVEMDDQGKVKKIVKTNPDKTRVPEPQG